MRQSLIDEWVLIFTADLTNWLYLLLVLMLHKWPVVLRTRLISIVHNHILIAILAMKWVVSFDGFRSGLINDILKTEQFVDECVHFAQTLPHRMITTQTLGWAVRFSALLIDPPLGHWENQVALVRLECLLAWMRWGRILLKCCQRWLDSLSSLHISFRQVLVQLIQAMLDAVVSDSLV
jgi:hypothetical protein